MPPGEAITERALLLNPFAGAHPAKHLQFNSDGTVEPRRSSERGRETIKAVGLNRPSLQSKRKHAVSDAHRALKVIGEASVARNAERTKVGLQDLVRLGEEDRNFAGCVRAVAEEALGLPWRDIEAAANAP